MHSAPTSSLPSSTTTAGDTKKTEGAGVPLWQVLVMIFTAFAIIFIGYKKGFSAENTKTRGVSTSLVREEYLLKQIGQCEQNRETLFTRLHSANDFTKMEREEIADLNKQLSDLKQSNDEAFESNKQFDTEKSHCDEDVDSEKMVESDADAKKKIQKLQATLGEVEDKFKAYKRISARRIMLLEVLRQRRRRNNELRLQLQEPAPEDAEDYEDSLVEKWKIAKVADGFPDDVTTIKIRRWTRRLNISSVNNKNDDNNNLGPGILSDSTIETVVSKWEKFNFDSLPANKKKEIFFIPDYDPEAALKDVDAVDLSKYSPKYFGRTGNPRGTVGVLDKTQEIRLTLAQMLRVLVRIGYCAMKDNNANFTVPGEFLRPSESTVSHEMIEQSAPLAIDTPLITFCTKCSHVIQTKEFQLACGGSGEQLSSPYGSHLFWKARSRVRFTNRVIFGAERYMRQNDITPNTTLAVDFKRSMLWDSACRESIARSTLPLKHYLWLAGKAMQATNGNGSLLEVSPSDAVSQCAPTVQDMRNGVITIAQSREWIDTVFIAADYSDLSILQSELTDIDLGKLQVVVSTPTDVVSDAVELEIMSQCDSILANRFSEHSQHVTELYLLQNKFNSEGVHFF